MLHPDQAGKGRLDRRGGAEPVPPYCKLLRLGTTAGINGRRRNRWSTWHRSVQYAQDRRSRCMQLNEDDRGKVVQCRSSFGVASDELDDATSQSFSYFPFVSPSEERVSGRAINKNSEKIVNHMGARCPLQLVCQPTLKMRPRRHERYSGDDRQHGQAERVSAAGSPSLRIGVSRQPHHRHRQD